MIEPITPAELEALRAALAPAPLAFRKRLVRMLIEAMSDEDDGTLELQAQVSGPKGARFMRQWEGGFRAVGRSKKP